MRAILSPGTQFWGRQPVFHMSCPKVGCALLCWQLQTPFPALWEMQWGQRRWEQPHRVFWSLNRSKIFPSYFFKPSFLWGRKEWGQTKKAGQGMEWEVGNTLAGWLRAVFTSKDMSSYCCECLGCACVPSHCAACSAPQGWSCLHRKTLFQK